jgi:hypothetical protein|tara:strand:+ start:932 stop:1243 length:312 start_codon:yes stop_codon:yes gene_type:complete
MADVFSAQVFSFSILVDTQINRCYTSCIIGKHTKARTYMIKPVLAITLMALLTACANTPTSYPRAHGENWKFYPYTPGSSFEIAAQGRACWDENNRSNWDQCE